MVAGEEAARPCALPPNGQAGADKTGWLGIKSGTGLELDRIMTIIAL